ncbi:hypothetical protein ECG_08071 [Echinococcus granulosus]|nr:hypothetical protein ECG_08071 [Echinococcus granulosus]
MEESHPNTEFVRSIVEEPRPAAWSQESVNGSVSVVSSFFFSPMDLAPILIAASSSDPQAVQLASTQLETAAKIFGLVHLKNLISNSTQWCNFDRAQQEFLITCLLQYLRQNSSPSPFVSEIFGRVFRHEWSKGTWPEELWNAIIELGAWTPLRRCVQRAAALRLTPRRRILASHICTLLPRLVGLWIESNSPELLHTIYTCITVLDASAAADMMSTHAAVVGGLITRAMARLLSSECKNPKRLAKLLHATETRFSGAYLSFSTSSLRPFATVCRMTDLRSSHPSWRSTIASSFLVVIR